MLLSLSHSFCRAAFASRRFEYCVIFHSQELEQRPVPQTSDRHSDGTNAGGCPIRKRAQGRLRAVSPTGRLVPCSHQAFQLVPVTERLSRPVRRLGERWHGLVARLAKHGVSAPPPTPCPEELCRW